MSSTLAPSWCLQQGEPWKWQDLLEPSSERIFHFFKESEFQQASSVRFRKLTLALAQELIDEQGFIDLQRLHETLSQIKKQLCPLKDSDRGDYLRMRHIESVLESLKDKKLRTLVETTSCGHGLRSMEHLVHLSLQGWPSHGPIVQHSLSDRDVRVALLSAWMSYLRQTIGSCFATAPAILILTQAPHLFLSDMQQLLHHGALKRTFEGKEFSVPAAEDPGLADLRKHLVAHERHAKAPGLMWTLAQGKLFTLKQNWQEDLERFSGELQPLIQALSAKQGTITALNLLEMWVCRHYGLSLEALYDYEQRPQALIPSGSLQMSTPGRSTSQDQAYYDLQRLKQLYCLWTDHPLLRMWEFTLASFSDTRRDMSLWSLHTSLGIDHEEPGGLAQRLRQILEEKVSEYNSKTHELNPSCENMNYQVQHVASRLQSAKTEQELLWLRTEYQNLKAELQQLQLEQEQYRQKAQAFANLYNQLLDRYVELISHHFQQVYDPQMQGAHVGPYDDTPAGFRLVFKSGRTHATSWTPIHSSAQFIDCIVRFLTVTEQEMMQGDELAPIRQDFSHLVTLLVQHVRSGEFLRSAYLRMAKGLKMPIDTSSDQTLEKSPITPWAYVSGGNMQALMSHYYGHSELAQEKQNWFKDLRELWVFLIDIMRDMPCEESAAFLKERTRGLLMHSSSHAFIFLPGHPTFVPCWESSMYPYTWIRDHYEQEVRQVYSNCFLEGSTVDRLLERFAIDNGLQIPKIKRLTPRLRPHELRSEVLAALSEKQLSPWRLDQLLGAFDGLLLYCLPAIDQQTLLRRIEEFCDQSPLLLVGARQTLKVLWMDRLKDLGAQVTADKIRESFYEAYRINAKIATFYGSTPDPHLLSVELARFKLGLPLPIFFADSNWEHDHFAFVLNPGSDALELWRLEPDSFKGEPMTAWFHEFEPSDLKKIWGCYNRPQDYRL